jgi:hypothetical protein
VAVRDYLVLALRLDRLVPGSVDAFTGDPRLRRAVADEPDPTAAGLVRAADRLLAALPDAGLASARVRFLGAQVRALRCSARRVEERPVGFVEEVQDCFDTTVGFGDPDSYAAAHRELAALLPGPGTVATRLAAYRRADEVPAPALAPAVRAVSTALRERVRRAYRMPGDEQVEYRIVDDAPWSGLHRYLGGHRSCVWVNSAARLRAAQLVPLVAHESYPGHHTEHVRKDVGLVAGRGHREHTVLLVDSPQSLLAEGVADLGLHAVLGPGWGGWAQEVLAGAGVASDGELAERVDRATTALLPVRLDAALLLHDRGAPEDEALAHLRRWLLVDDTRARQMLRFLTHPRWRAYSVTYVEGFRLLWEWLHRPGPDAADHAARFARLLDEPLTPAAVRAEIAAATGRVAVAPSGGQPDMYFR